MDSPDLKAFAPYIPGFDFLLNLSRQAAGSVVPGGQAGVAGMPPMGHWVAPTFDVEELDKRIQDLRAVHFWLEQNTKALGVTIQALEVQKMTLATLKGMNVGLGEMAEAFKIRPEPAAAPAPEAAATSSSSSVSPTPPRPAADPLQWWHSLSDQFQTLASGAVRDMAEHASRAAEPVAKAASAAPAPAKTAAKKAGAPKAGARKAAPARKKPVKPN